VVSDKQKCLNCLPSMSGCCIILNKLPQTRDPATLKLTSPNQGNNADVGTGRTEMTEPSIVGDELAISRNSPSLYWI